MLRKKIGNFFGEGLLKKPKSAYAMHKNQKKFANFFANFLFIFFSPETVEKNLTKLKKILEFFFGKGLLKKPKSAYTKQKNENF
jgi:hypothetical protein